MFAFVDGKSASATALLGDYQALTFELTNTTGITSTLELRPADVKIKSTKEDYNLCAAALVGASGEIQNWWIFSELKDASQTVQLPGGGIAIASFSGKSGRYRIEVSPRGVVELQFAFKLPAGVGRYELSWPELPSMHLGEIVVSIPVPTNTPLSPTPRP